MGLQDMVNISCTGKCVHWSLKFGESFDLSESENFKPDQEKYIKQSMTHAAMTLIKGAKIAEAYLKGEQ